MGPILIDNPSRKYDKNAFMKIPVDCGECPDCLKKRSSAWTFKIQQECKRAFIAEFVTLTYDPDVMTKESGRITPKGLMTLVKRDYQLFFKRLRYISPKGVSIRYFLGAEYGSITKRPHAHLILLNAQRELIERAWSVDGQSLGFIHFGKEVNDATIAYTVKYMHKGKDIPAFAGDDRLPEFHLFSKGLGLNYITPAIIEYHNSDPWERNCAILQGGVRIALPRSFRDKIFPENVRKQMGRYFQNEFIEQEIARQREYARTHGGDLTDYYKDQLENKRFCIDVFLNRQKSRE